jgi:hypothetical protein
MYDRAARPGIVPLQRHVFTYRGMRRPFEDTGAGVHPYPALPLGRQVLRDRTRFGTQFTSSRAALLQGTKPVLEVRDLTTNDLILELPLSALSLRQMRNWMIAEPPRAGEVALDRAVFQRIRKQIRFDDFVIYVVDEEQPY